jgi:AcrR family transcriptional regulator
MAPVEHRLLVAGKRLFASQGFESTTTSAIAKEAGTSESQLIKYFGSKEGLLIRIFEEGWKRVSFVYTAASISSTPAEGLRVMFELLVRILTEDKEMRDLMLFEGRRIRRQNSMVLLTGGYYKLYDEVTRQLTLMLDGTELAPRIRPRSITSAFIGMLESMLRDQAISERSSGQSEPSSDEIRGMYHVFINCLVSAIKSAEPNS